MESFRNCGWPAFAALGMGTLALIMAIAAIAMALLKPRLGVIVAIVALAMSVGPGGVGFLGMLWQRQQVDSILAAGVIEPQSIERIRTIGYEEAAQCVPVGGVISVVPMFFAGIALVVSLVRKKNETAA